MIKRYAHFFETLSADFNDEEFRDYFSPKAVFTDPFQSVTGIEAIIKIFRHMYATLEDPKFIVVHTAMEDNKGYILWTFYYNSRSFRGISYIEFDIQGKVTAHTDYWDAAENIYENLPVLGTLLRWIKRKVAA